MLGQQACLDASTYNGSTCSGTYPAVFPGALAGTIGFLGGFDATLRVGGT